MQNLKSPCTVFSEITVFCVYHKNQIGYEFAGCQVLLIHLNSLENYLFIVYFF